MIYIHTVWILLLLSIAVSVLFPNKGIVTVFGCAHVQVYVFVFICMFVTVLFYQVDFTKGQGLWFDQKINIVSPSPTWQLICCFSLSRVTPSVTSVGWTSHLPVCRVLLSTQQAADYAKTIPSLITREKHTKVGINRWIHGWISFSVFNRETLTIECLSVCYITFWYTDHKK